MCGFLVVSSRSPISNLESRLSSACNSLSHRGPDYQDYYASDDSNIGLAHTRLAIQDVSALGNQPMSTSDNSVTIVFNGEIYNVLDLKASLASKGYSFKGTSDTEVLLYLYLEYGTNFLERLNGIFSFAIWDKSQNSLWVCRDSLGVKPVYYSFGDGFFICASEMKALRDFGLAIRTVDPIAIDNYMSYIWSPGTKTPAENVSKLSPGEWLLIRGGELVCSKKWFSLPSTRIFNNIHSTALPCSLSQIISDTSEFVRRSVHRQMISDVPVGAFLSGGLDSSSIVTFARQIKPDIQCFSIKLSNTGTDGFVDDLPYAHKVARHLNVPLSVITVDAHQMADNIEDMVFSLDEPLADPACLNVYYICKLARQSGIKVLLSGTGGDDLFTGYRRHLALHNERFWSWLPRPCRVLFRSLTGSLPSDKAFFRRLRKAFSGAHLEGDSRLVHYFRWIERADLERLYSSEFLASLRQARAEDPLLEFLATFPSNTPALERMLALEQRFFLADHNLTYTDKMSMAVGVEVRVPFLDPDLVEFAAQIPPQFKQRGREGKWILKKAMEQYLPMDVIYRPKSGFGAPLRRWLQVELRDWLTDTLSTDRLQRRGIFDAHAVQRLIKANAEGKIDASYTLLSLACIEIWCRYFIDLEASPNKEPCL